MATVANASTFRNPVRLMNSLLTPLERRCLLWMAPRLPRWVNSDHLTGLAFAAMILAGLSYWLASVMPIGLPLVVFFLAVNWFGDSLDGTLARVRNHQRPRYGYYVDHVIDVAGTACLMAGLSLSGYMHPLVTAVVLVAYLMLCAEVFLATHSLDKFRMSYVAIGPTELRIILSIGTLWLLADPTVTISRQAYRLFDVGGVVAAVGMVLTFVASAIGNTCALYRAEPIPGDRT